MFVCVCGLHSEPKVSQFNRHLLSWKKESQRQMRREPKEGTGDGFAKRGRDAREVTYVTTSTETGRMPKRSFLREVRSCSLPMGGPSSVESNP